MEITKSDLKAANHENLVRLAKSLKLHDVETMSHGQLARLVHWRLSRRAMWRKRRLHLDEWGW